MVDLGKSPLCESFLPADRLEAMEPFYPLHVRVCTTLLARAAAGVRPAGRDLRPSTPTSPRTPTRGSSTHARYVEMITDRLGLAPESLVVELASNDGYLLQHFVPKGIPVLGIDPAANVAAAAEERGVPTLVEFFGVELAERARRRARTGRSRARQQRARPGAGPERLRRRASRCCSRPTGRRRSSSRISRGCSRAAVRHDLPRALLVLLARRRSGEVFAAHGLDVVDVEELPSHGGSLRVYARARRRPDASRRPRSPSCSRARRPRGCAIPTATAASRRTSRSRSARCSSC